MKEGYVDVNKAAEFLGCSVRTVKNRVAEARAGLHNFPFYQDVPGGNLTFKLSELEQWRRNRKIEKEINAKKSALRMIRGV